MQKLGETDLERLWAFLEETSVPCDLSSFPARVLPSINKLVPATVVCHAEVDPAEAKLVSQTLHASGSEGAYLAGPFEQFMMEHPVFQHWSQTGDMSAARSSDFVGRREWHKRDLYQYVYKEGGCEDSLAIGLPAPPGLLACFCIERDVNFTDRERQLMEIVRPHLANAYRNAEAFTLLAQATAPGGTYSILIDAAGRPLYASDATWELISAYLPDANGASATFPESLAAWIWNQLARFSRDRELPAAATPLVLKRSGSSLTLRLLPGPTTGAQALLVMQEHHDGVEGLPPELGLTAREVEVLQAATRGSTATEIADALCISRRTVEKHLENIYNKLGVDSRGAAVARTLFPSES